ncbi:LacI family DNA-binding transcriptional regulator [Naumannella huperziae]
MARQISMRRVAERAGVSVSTVSHVVNGTRVVAPGTVDRVRRAMAELGYVAPAEGSLRAGDAQSIGVAMTAVSSEYWAALVDAIDREAGRHGYNLLIVDTRDDAEHEARMVANLLAHRIAGLVLAPSPGWTAHSLPVLRAHDTPLVLVDRLQPAPYDQVGVENLEGSQGLVGHLITHDHRRIGLITGLDGLTTTDERVAGYRAAHERFGVPVDEALLVGGQSSTTGGRAAAAALLDLPEPPTAIFAANNAMLVGLLDTLWERRLSVPGDMAVVGFDDFTWADFMRPALTTVAQPSTAIGAKAIQLLLARLADPERRATTVRLPGQIRHRESCGCSGRPHPGAGDEDPAEVSRAGRPRSSAAGSRRPPRR